MWSKSKLKRTTTKIFLPGWLGCKEDWAHEGALDWSNIERGCPEGLFHLIGYSMGGRVALMWAQQYPERIASLTLISAHLGLSTEKERAERWQRDLATAKQLREGPLDDFLKKWYAQPLFAPLVANKALFAQVLERRKKIDPEFHAHLLLKYSLAKQPPYQNALPSRTRRIAGALDTAYAAHADVLIPDAGHAVHLERSENLDAYLCSIS